MISQSWDLKVTNRLLSSILQQQRASLKNIGMQLSRINQVITFSKLSQLLEFWALWRTLWIRGFNKKLGSTVENYFTKKETLAEEDESRDPKQNETENI